MFVELHHVSAGDGPDRRVLYPLLGLRVNELHEGRARVVPLGRRYGDDVVETYDEVCSKIAAVRAGDVPMFERVDSDEAQAGDGEAFVVPRGVRWRPGLGPVLTADVGSGEPLYLKQTTP